MGPPPRERIIAAFGITVGLAMILMKVVPRVPGHFSGYEWLSLAIWVAFGVVLAWRSGRTSQLA
jgi:hypothetical protein